jgi:hypothetical protein
MSTAARRFVIVTDTFDADRPGTGRRAAYAYTAKQTRKGRRVRQAKPGAKSWFKAWRSLNDCPSVFTKEEAEYFLPLFSTSGVVCQIVEQAQ